MYRDNKSKVQITKKACQMVLGSESEHKTEKNNEVIQMRKIIRELGEGGKFFKISEGNKKQSGKFLDKRKTIFSIKDL